MRERRIAFEKIINCRDLGGLKTADGPTIASGLLLRSANLAEATEEDRKVLREKYHLAKIIDLRTETERRERPDVEYIPIPIFDERAAGITHEKKNAGTTAFRCGSGYGAAIPHNGGKRNSRQNLGRAARCVMEHDFSKGSVLWHGGEGPVRVAQRPAAQRSGREPRHDSGGLSADQ